MTAADLNLPPIVARLESEICSLRRELAEACERAEDAEARLIEATEEIQALRGQLETIAPNSSSLAARPRSVVPPIWTAEQLDAQGAIAAELLAAMAKHDKN